MAILTLKCAGQKDLTFKFGQGAEGLSITDKFSQVIKNLFDAAKNGNYTAKNSNEYNEISVFLKDADADGDGTIDGKDYEYMRNNPNKVKKGMIANGGEDHDAIEKKKQDGNFYSIFVN